MSCLETLWHLSFRDTLKLCGCVWLTFTSMLYSASSVRMWAENSCSSMWAWTREFSSPATQQTLINPRRRLVRRLPADRSYRQRVPWSSCACWPSSFALFRRRPRWRLWSPRWTAGRWSSSTVWSACKHKHSLLPSGVAQGLQTVWNVTSDLCRASKLSSFSTWVSALTSRRRTEWVCRLDSGSTSKSSSMDLRDTAGGNRPIFINHRVGEFRCDWLRAVTSQLLVYFVIYCLKFKTQAFVSTEDNSVVTNQSERVDRK